MNIYYYDIIDFTVKKNSLKQLSIYSIWNADDENYFS